MRLPVCESIIPNNYFDDICNPESRGATRENGICGGEYGGLLGFRLLGEAVLVSRGRNE